MYAIDEAHEFFKTVFNEKENIFIVFVSFLVTLFNDVRSTICRE
jgi:hypothetical protein